MILENESRAGKSAVYATSRLSVYYSNSQIQSCYYTFLYWHYGSIWFDMCSIVLSPQTVLNDVINSLSNFCYQSKILVIS